MTTENKTVGQLMDELEVLGTMNYVDLNGKIWKLKYEGSVEIQDWVTLGDH